jgi:tocopherol O-methyltransferase
MKGAHRMAWTHKDIIRYYNTNNWAYRWLFGTNFHFGYWDKGVRTQKQSSQRLVQVMAEMLKPTPHDTILDAGCGVGGSSIYLAKTYGCKATGITITPRQVEQAYAIAKKEGVSHLTEFHVMDYLNPTFADKTFSIVWGLESICYAESKKRFVEESFRLLKDKGKLIVGDGFASRETYAGNDAYLQNRWLAGWRVNFLNTPDKFKEFAKEAGFSRSSYRDITKEVFRTSVNLYIGSLPFLPLHILDGIFHIKSYPTDAIYHQFHAMRKGLWEYGIFYAEK